MAKKLPVVINDALLVGALLSAADRDDIHPDNLAAVLQLTTMRLIAPESTDRASCPSLSFVAGRWLELHLTPRVVQGKYRLGAVIFVRGLL